MVGIDELNYIKRLRFVIETNLIILKKMRAEAGSVSAIDTTIPKVSKVGSKGNYDWEAIQLVEQQEKIDQYQEEYDELKKEIMKNVKKMNDPVLREIIISHYIEDKELKIVARVIGYSSHIYQLHAEALEEYGRAKSQIALDDLCWPSLTLVRS